MQTELLKEQNNYMTGSDSFLRAHQDALSGQRADLSVMLQTPKNSHAVDLKLDQRFDVLVVDRGDLILAPSPIPGFWPLVPSGGQN